MFLILADCVAFVFQFEKCLHFLFPHIAVRGSRLYQAARALQRDHNPPVVRSMMCVLARVVLPTSREMRHEKRFAAYSSLLDLLPLPPYCE